MPRDAGVRLTLDNSSFLTTIRATDSEVEKLGRRGQRSMQLITSSVDAAKRSIGGMLGEGRRLGGMLATLGGAWSVGNAIRSGVKLQSTYRQIAFGVKDANGAMLTAAQVQQTTERAAAKTGQRNEEMAASYRSLIDATGDLEFSRSVLESVGHTALATGDSLDVTANLADQLHTKFGVAADGMQDARPGLRRGEAGRAEVLRVQRCDRGCRAGAARRWARGKARAGLHARRAGRDG